VPSRTYSQVALNRPSLGYHVSALPRSHARDGAAVDDLLGPPALNKARTFSWPGASLHISCFGRSRGPSVCTLSVIQSHLYTLSLLQIYTHTVSLSVLFPLLEKSFLLCGPRTLLRCPFFRAPTSRLRQNQSHPPSILCPMAPD
jgi:hypothetical protein